MPRKCSICTNNDHESIDQALTDGETSLRNVAKKWSVSKSALIRHRDGHLHMSISPPGEPKAIPDDTPITVQDAQRELRRQLASMIRQ